MNLFQMDFFIFILLLMVVVGAGFIVAGSFSKSSTSYAEDKEDFNGGLSSISQKLDNLETYVSEADDAANMLGDMSKNVFKELDSKYQELLFLYNLIDEKQKVLDKASGEANSEIPDDILKRIDIVIDDSKKMPINPKFANVLELHRSGKSIEQIAKQLDMGKGQVELILNLGGPKNA